MTQAPEATLLVGGNGGCRGGIGLTSEPWKSQQRLLNEAQVSHPHLLTVISGKSLHLSEPPFPHLIKDKNHIVILSETSGR